MATYGSEQLFTWTFVEMSKTPKESSGFFGEAGLKNYYTMRAIDAGRPAGSNYITWEATTADFAGAGYASGSPTPIGSMVVGSAVVVAVKLG